MKLSEGYKQLAGIFEALENAKLEPDQDFGANVASCFSWYLSPRAVQLLDKKYNSSWLALKYNQQFTWNYQPWGDTGKGVDIRLKM